MPSDGIWNALCTWSYVNYLLLMLEASKHGFSVEDAKLALVCS